MIVTFSPAWQTHAVVPRLRRVLHLIAAATMSSHSPRAILRSCDQQLAPVSRSPPAKVFRYA
jgi:hypothetical protein